MQSVHLTCTLSCYCDEIPGERRQKESRADFGSLIWLTDLGAGEGRFNHGENATTAGTGGSWSNGTHRQETESNKCLCLTHLLFSYGSRSWCCLYPRPGPSTIFVTLLGLYLCSSLQSLVPNQTILYHVIKTMAREGFECSHNQEMTKAWDDEALALISWVDRHIVGYIMERD